MSLKRKFLAMTTAVVLVVSSFGTLTASAVGESDYGQTATKSVSEGGNTTLSSSKVGVGVAIPEDALPEGVTEVSMAAKKIDTDSNKTAAKIEAALEKKGLTNVTVMTISIKDQDGKSITNKVTEPVTYKIKVDDDVNVVYGYKDGKLTKIPCTVKNGFIIYEAEGYAHFAFAAK